MPGSPERTSQALELPIGAADPRRDLDIPPPSEPPPDEPWDREPEPEPEIAPEPVPAQSDRRRSTGQRPRATRPPGTQVTPPSDGIDTQPTKAEPAAAAAAPAPDPAPRTAAPASPPAPPSAQTPAQTPAPPQTAPSTPPAPRPMPPDLYADSVIARLRERMTDVVDTLGMPVDLLSRQVTTTADRLQAATERTQKQQTEIEEASKRAGETLRKSITDVAKEAQLLMTAAREATGSIGMARHELALAHADLRKKQLIHASIVGAAVGILVLLMARMMFPFWGLTRDDLRALSTGTQVLETYRNAPDAQRTEILRSLRMRELPR